ncbi:hypothetical protein [Streptomyces sp. ISL-86]|uniref:hypothetical protein n=1 Tax=Streptomyces sp. ISL-86 TaxID=2819187 RepID=UPI001BE6C53F|nr:hypothetical protein [Streptomyces sp. ISL-86]MBT2455293.1 hypothetical protein [Streptomyces sp. ISL-86]
MADERNRWLDKAAADKLLRGEPVAPVADHHAQAEAALLRAALDDLAPRPAADGPELPGEAAALAAFRTAHGGVRPEAAAPSQADGIREPLVKLAHVASAGVPAPRRGTTVRFGLAAALASIAVGGLAAAAGAGLLDQPLNTAAGRGPAVAVSTDADPTPTGAGGGAEPRPPVPLQPTPLREGQGSAAVGGSSNTPGTEGGTSPGFGSGNSSHPASVGGTGTTFKDRLPDGGTTFGGTSDHEAEKTLKATDLCEDYRSGRLDDDRRERLSKLAKGAAKIAHYCEALLDGVRESDAPGGTRQGDVLQAPTPAGSTLDSSGSLGPRSRL